MSCEFCDEAESSRSPSCLTAIGKRGWVCTRPRNHEGDHVACGNVDGVHISIVKVKGCDMRKDKEEFFELLKRHDWGYQYADDPFAFNAGRSQHENLIRMTRGDEWKLKAYSMYADSQFSTKQKPTIEDVDNAM